MAETVVGYVIAVLVEKISDELMSFAQSEGLESQLKKLAENLPLIQAVLADAGQKQVIYRSVELWLHELHDLAYDIDDVLDDLATEAMRRKLNQEPLASRPSIITGKVMKLIPTCCTNFTPRHIKYGMSSKLDEITARLQELVDHINYLGLDVNAVRSDRNNNRPLEQTSLVDESKIMGLEGNKEALMEKLLGNEACNENVSVVSIVGIGGVGKTTLAKVLYDDDKVKDHFELRAWIHVSDDFDVFNISKAIFQAVSDEDKNFDNLYLLQVALKEKLSNKRFLLVLDDVWNEDHEKWELLQRPFVVGACGSKVIVTTRKSYVALVMDSVADYHLEVLSTDKALSLFAQHSLGEPNFNEHPTLEPLAIGFVKKCGGLPLALIMLGRVLKTKRDEDEWKELLYSEIWELSDEDVIVPALRLSYYDMSPHLKQLFAYCSLFPKDYKFAENELVLLWMAEGFLSKSNGHKSMEQLGHEYFEELKSRSFFQHSLDEESKYTMHDLINDLAVSVAGAFFFLLDDMTDAYDRNEEKFRHFSFIGRKDGVYRKLKEIRRSRCLRTFLPITIEAWGSEPYISLNNIDLVELLPRLLFLRVLSLAYCEITEVPESIGDLKHMRYLNFSHTKITCLPKQVGDLYNLQTLLVSHCWELLSLPINFAKLKNLRHLDTSDTPLLKDRPLGIDGLMSQQTLIRFIIEGPKFNISKLKDRSDLQGRVSIEGLHNVTNVQQAKKANLQQKDGIDELVLEWSDVFDSSRNVATEYEVLKELRPHHKLRKLEVKFYGGKEFPNWAESQRFDHLTEFRLRLCRNLVSFGASVESVREVFINGCDKLEKYECSNSVERLEIVDCSSMTSLTGSMESLKEVCIEGCDNMEGYDCPASVERLEIIYCGSMTSLTGSMESVKKVFIRGCDKLYKYKCSNNVERLKIVDCGSLKSLTGSMESVRDVCIRGCDKLESCCFPTSVGRLEIGKCDSMTFLTFSPGPSSYMKYLHISNCKNLKSFPHQHLQSLTSLKEMWIDGCPSMDDFPCGLWPPNLENLVIGRLKKPMAKWEHQSYPPSLVHLTLIGKNSGVASFAVEKDVNTSAAAASFLLPTSLTSLSIRHFKDVKSLEEVLQHFPSLKELHIYHCPKLKPLPDTSSSLKVRVVGSQEKQLLQFKEISMTWALSDAAS